MRIPVGAAATLVVIAVGGGAAATAGIVGYRTAYGVGTATAAEHMARAVQVASEDVPRAPDPESFVESLALLTGYRASLFGPSGEYLADSAFPRSELGGGGEQGRTEVAAALLRTTGFAIRPSLQDGRRYAYSARRVHWSGQNAVLRVAVPLDPLRSRALRAGAAAALAALMLSLVAALVVSRQTAFLSQDLKRATAFLRQLGTGPRKPERLPLSQIVEVAQVASVANRLSSDIEARLEEERRELNELRSLMDQVAEGLLALTDDARVLTINPAGRRLLGLAEVLPFSPVGTIIREPALRDLLEASVVRPALEEELIVGDRVLRVKTRRSSGGGSVVLLLDVTEIRRLEAVRTDFVANASHELKTPLTVIRGAAETVLQGELPPELETQFLLSIQGNAVRLQRLVEDLLDLSRFESGGWMPAGDPIDLEKVVRQVWADLVRTRGDKVVGFRLEGQAEALGDKSAVYQVFQNLLDNAIRYVPDEKGEILVELRSSDSTVEVSVHDNGTGIPATAITRIFERFYRVDAARSRQEGGTGLGLAIVRHLVTSMGGEVWAESTLGLGTVMRFVLPAAKAGAAVEGESDATGADQVVGPDGAAPFSHGGD
ncbi:MAG: GHKL domain-containing protein [Gemmatimonadetes bacterium]|nr:GHKL domain-containing protein [Gemmatimonadota bacterium]